MLFTYGDVVRRARALMDDQDAQVYNNTFLLEYVDSSLNILSSALVTNSARIALLRTPVPILIPAGATELSRLKGPVEVMNLKSSSDDFVGSGSWTHPVGGRPDFVTDQTILDPLGGTTASAWRYPIPGAAIIDYADTTGAVNYTDPSDNNFHTASIWLKSTTMYPMTVNLSVGYDSSGTYTEVDNRDFDITNEWRRISLSVGPFSILIPSRPAFRITFWRMDTTESTRTIHLWRATMTDKSFDMLPDVRTNSIPVIATTNALPTNYIAAQQLWEKGVSDQDYQYQQMYGPVQIPDAVQGQFLRWWDTREGEIKLPGATDDRLVRMDYWGDLGSFTRQTTGAETDESQVFPLADASAFEASAHLVAHLATRAKGALDQSDRFASISEDGIGGAAGFFVTNLINSQIKMKQAVAQRRQPYFGTRYPGYTDRVLGGY